MLTSTMICWSRLAVALHIAEAATRFAAEELSGLTWYRQSVCPATPDRQQEVQRKH